MEPGYIIIALVGIVVGIVFCIAISRMLINKDITGTVYIVKDDVTGEPYPYLESNILLEDLALMNKATFRIKTVRQNSHK
jgi:hypothetical protein